MKRIYSKILTCMLIALLAISTMSMCIPVKASTLTYDEFNFSFKDGCTVSRNVTGMFMDVRVKATANNNNNETITLKILLENRDVLKTYTFLSDGQYHTYNNIFLGFSGGSSVAFTFVGANPEITINVYMEIGS